MRGGLGRPSARLLAGLLLLALPLGRVPAQAAGDSFLRGEFWTDLDLPPREGEVYPVSETEAAKRLLEEAAWVFSGMTEGFDFTWTPENKGRQVKESFSLSPLASLVFGDPRLAPGPASKSSSRLSTWIDYRPDASELLSLEGSKGPQWRSVQGRGAALRSLGFANRREAYAAAAKAALEVLMRGEEAARPREVRGRLVFAAVPAVVVEDDAWVVSLRARIEILEVRRWFLY